ncbi:23274_t:CDS:1 [Dentiscutata erythropus]|uniref:23274_t:CDS:1 n=1 Tax=Dentiscutata erythropus TaxID=1348616 RepID=A0A9N9FQ21_9GLOM|nr:23274_t:CDS:1 [Dentiscutata erythropus]
MLVVIDNKSNFKILEDSEVFHQSSKTLANSPKHEVLALLVPNDYTEWSYHYAETLEYFGLWRKSKDVVKLGKDTDMKYEDLKSLPIHKKQLAIPRLDSNANHILVLHGGIHEPVVLYICREGKYYPKSSVKEIRQKNKSDYVKGNDICSKFDTKRSSGKYKIEEIQNESNEIRYIEL